MYLTVCNKEEFDTLIGAIRCAYVANWLAIWQGQDAEEWFEANRLLERILDGVAKEQYGDSCSASFLFGVVLIAVGGDKCTDEDE